MTCTSKLQNNIRNEFPILDNPTKVLSFMLRTLLVLKLLKCPTPDGGHLGFVQYGRHRGSPSWLPREIGRRWSYLPLVQKWCLWNDVNNYLIKPPDYQEDTLFQFEKCKITVKMTNNFNLFMLYHIHYLESTYIHAHFWFTKTNVTI